jgi:hypothetical protein
MQLTNIFVALLLSTAVAAKGNSTKSSTKAVTDKSLCNQMAKLEKTVALASNTTKLDAKTNGNATKIAEIQAKASTAAATLATMSTNTTLISTCAVIAAAEDTEDSCDKMASLMKSVALAANTTKLDAKAKGNETKVAELQAKASTAATKLETMTTNTTLVAACSSIAAAKTAQKGMFFLYQT